MEICLFDKEYGYYNQPNPIGSEGAFTTAPEMTQVFGELIGLFLVQYWLDYEKTSPFSLVELGPGRGTLMSDMLRASQTVPEYLDASMLYLLEQSTTLKRHQQKRLNSYSPKWLETVEELPNQPVFAVANEFFDALPIRQFLRSNFFWKERLVGCSGNALHYEFSQEFEFLPLQARLSDTIEGDIVEYRPGAQKYIKGIVARIKKYGGIFLIIDYGRQHSLGDTFQALDNSKYTDPLENPGQADLTSHVDFGALVAKIEGITSHLVDQGDFLKNMGIEIRAGTLSNHLTGAELVSHKAAINRLISPDQMGTLFKVMTLFSNGEKYPQGLGVKTI